MADLFGAQGSASTPRQREWLAIFLFAVGSLGAVVAGSTVIAAVTKTSAFWLRDLIAWIAGAILATSIVTSRFTRALRFTLLGLAVVGLGFTLINEGTLGVHRWLDIGPLHVNIASLLLPPLLVVLAANRLRKPLTTTLALSVALVLCIQPDASQATAFVAAFLILQGEGLAHSVAQRIAALALVACVVLSWIRPNPLPAIPEVEGVVGVAWHFSPVIAGVGIACLIIAALSPLLLGSGDSPGRKAAFALTTYFALTAIAPAVGAYPVPLMGAGMSAIAGFWLGIGCLIGLHRQRRITSAQESLLVRRAPTRRPSDGKERDEVSKRTLGVAQQIA